jgi:DNA repair exonuclease SbcCD ATPase subunit
MSVRRVALSTRQRGPPVGSVPGPSVRAVLSTTLSTGGGAAIDRLSEHVAAAKEAEAEWLTEAETLMQVAKEAETVWHTEAEALITEIKHHEARRDQELAELQGKLAAMERSIDRTVERDKELAVSVTQLETHLEEMKNAELAEDKLQERVLSTVTGLGEELNQVSGMLQALEGEHEVVQKHLDIVQARRADIAGEFNSVADMAKKLNAVGEASEEEYHRAERLVGELKDSVSTLSSQP